MDTHAHVAAVEAQSRRCIEVLRTTDLDAPVPSCPDWRAADLAWHLADVQHSWAAIVLGLLDDDEDVPELTRPADTEVVDLLADRASALVTSLRDREPSDACWSWHPEGGTVGWVARRQAHEALIHRVDAELAAGAAVADADPELAGDGVDELLHVMIDGVPPWGTFAADDARLTVDARDVERRWTLSFGRFRGTSPDSGRTYDLDAALVGPPDIEVAATVAGDAWALDRWLWGRGDSDALAHTGADAHALASRLRSLAADTMG